MYTMQTHTKKKILTIHTEFPQTIPRPPARVCPQDSCNSMHTVFRGSDIPKRPDHFFQPTSPAPHHCCCCCQRKTPAQTVMC